MGLEEVRGAIAIRAERHVLEGLACSLALVRLVARRYPELPVFGQPRPGETFDITVTVDGGTSAGREVGRP